MEKRILITGGLGFIGSHFVDLMLQNGYYVINLDKRTYAARLDLDFDKRGNYEFIEGDICTFKHLPPNINWVVNFAAESHVDNSILANHVFFESNVRGVYNLLELIRAKDSADRPIFMQISTDEVYGDILGGSKDENDKPKPSNPYSASKSAAEQLVFGWGRTYGIKYLICRSSNNYGEGQYPEKLIPKTIEFAMHGKKMTVHGDGSYSREWTYVRDNCEGILLVLEKGKLGEIYNISSGEIFSNLEIVKRVLCALGKPKDMFKFIENRVGQDIRYSVKFDKIKALGWQPKMSFNDFLAGYVKKIKQQYEKKEAI